MVPFVGREQQIEQLVSSREAVLDGCPSLYLIRGSSGAGKSALLTELSSRLRPQVMTVSTTCTLGEGPYAPFKRIAAEAFQLVMVGNPKSKRKSSLRKLGKGILAAGPEIASLLFPPLGAIGGLARQALDYAGLTKALETQSAQSSDWIDLDPVTAFMRLFILTAELSPLCAHR